MLLASAHVKLHRALHPEELRAVLTASPSCTRVPGLHYGKCLMS